MDKKYNRSIKNYGIAGVLCLVFAFGYELFSHQVYSVYMICSPVFPFLGGMFIMLLLKKVKAPFPGDGARRAYAWGIATLTIGSIMNGVFEIYGSESELTSYYWLAGIFMIVAADLMYLFRILVPEKQTVA